MYTRVPLDPASKATAHWALPAAAAFSAALALVAAAPGFMRTWPTWEEEEEEEEGEGEGEEGLQCCPGPSGGSIRLYEGLANLGGDIGMWGQSQNCEGTRN